MSNLFKSISAAQIAHALCAKPFAAFFWECTTVGFGILPYLEACKSTWPWFEIELPRSNRAKTFLAVLYAIKSTKEIKYSTLHQVVELWVKPAKARKNRIGYLCPQPTYLPWCYSWTVTDWFQALLWGGSKHEVKSVLNFFPVIFSSLKSNLISLFLMPCLFWEPYRNTKGCRILMYVEVHS